MDAKSLREAMKAKAKRLAGASSEKVDSSDFTPAEMLNADVKTGMRPISRRAFKSGGKVEGGEVEARGDRTPRGSVGLANTNQRVANEDRDGIKHVGGFKKGGAVKKANGGMATSPRPMKRNDEEIAMLAKMASVNRSADNEDGHTGTSVPMMRPKARPIDAPIDAEGAGLNDYKKGGKVAKRHGGSTGGSDSDPITTAGGDAGGRQAKKKGGMVEGSAKDVAEDKAMAKKAGMSMKAWEKSPADAKHDKGCTCKACGGGVSDRMARKDGGRTGKGKTNINIIIHPNEGKEGKPMMPPVMPPPMMPKPPMPMPAPAAGAPMQHPMPLPAGLGAAMAGAAGVGPTPPMGPAQPPMPMPMARKDGGKVYPKMHAGAGSGEGRLEKAAKYGAKAKA